MNKFDKGVSTLTGIIIIIVVVAILFCGVFAYQYFSAKTQPVVQTQTTQNAGWKTYTNTQYGFQINYVTDLPGVNLVTSGVSNVNKKFPTVEVISDISRIDSNGCYIINSPNPARFIKHLTINNMNFCLNSTGDSGMGMSDVSYDYTTQKSGKYFVIEFNFEYSYARCENGTNPNDCFNEAKEEGFFESLVSTFKFIK